MTEMMKKAKNVINNGFVVAKNKTRIAYTTDTEKVLVTYKNVTGEINMKMKTIKNKKIDFTFHNKQEYNNFLYGY